ncbi:hypothetical protein B0O99DRAFT_722107 [Bisporella sp. PMI_857]|nr:hypothetical protein B0O99DRAFT_722107 [Bisporella sp. PMI_857]
MANATGKRKPGASVGAQPGHKTKQRKVKEERNGMVVQEDEEEDPSLQLFVPLVAAKGRESEPVRAVGVEEEMEIEDPLPRGRKSEPVKIMGLEKIDEEVGDEEEDVHVMTKPTHMARKSEPIKKVRLEESEDGKREGAHQEAENPTRKSRKSEPTRMVWAMKAYGDGSGNEREVQGLVSKARHLEPVNNVRDDEYEEDTGRNESQDFLTLIKFEKRKKKKAEQADAAFLKMFKDTLRHGEESLKTQIQDESNLASRRDIEFLKTFEKVFKRASPFSSAKGSGDKDKDGSQNQGFESMHPKSEKLVKTALGLIARFEEIETHVTNIDVEQLRHNSWAVEDDQIMEMLQTGRDFGMQKCRIILTTKAKEGDVAAEEANTERATIKNTFYSNTVSLEGTSGNWGKTARQQQKAAKKLVMATVVIPI